MKKIILFMLVAMVPFLTMAQKRTKKGKTKTTENQEKTKDSKTTFMIIKAVEMPISRDVIDIKDPSRDVQELKMKQTLKPESKIIVSYDYGSSKSKEVVDLMNSSRSFKSLSEAVNKAKEFGWEFINANILKENGFTTHYIYMKR